VSDRLVRFSGDSWQEIEALPESVRWTVQRVIFHPLEEPVPTLADPFPEQDLLPGAYELRRLSLVQSRSDAARWRSDHPEGDNERDRDLYCDGRSPAGVSAAL
jgi:hypothetical protein